MTLNNYSQKINTRKSFLRLKKKNKRLFYSQDEYFNYLWIKYKYFSCLNNSVDPEN